MPIFLTFTFPSFIVFAGVLIFLYFLMSFIYRVSSLYIYFPQWFEHIHPIHLSRLSSSLHFYKPLLSLFLCFSWRKWESLLLAKLWLLQICSHFWFSFQEKLYFRWLAWGVLCAEGTQRIILLQGEDSHKSGSFWSWTPLSLSFEIFKGFYIRLTLNSFCSHMSGS